MKTKMFTAAWCGPCKAVKRMLEKESNAKLAEKIRFIDIDTPSGSKLMEELNVRAVPCFVRPDGTKSYGSLNAKELSSFIERDKS